MTLVPRRSSATQYRRRRRAGLFGAVLVSGLANAGISAQAPDARSSNELEALLERGVSMFNSAEQPDSVDVFGELIERIDALDDGVNFALTLASGLSYRAQAQFNLGEEVAAETDLRRLLQIAPRTRLDPTLISPKLIQLFDDLRAAIVGDLAVSIAPAEARAYVDGREVSATLEPIPIAEGPHSLRVTKLGYSVFEEQIEIVASQTIPVQVFLERISAVVTVRTREPGASVTVDGRSVGETVLDESPDEGAGAEATLSFDGVDVGTHAVEIRRDGYHPHTGQIMVSDLVEYRLDPVALQRMAGVGVVRGVPSGAQLRVGGRDISTSASGGDIELELDPGDYPLEVEGGRLGAFTADVEVVDRGRHVVDVTLRPSVYFLGVIGEDAVARANITAAIEPMGRAGRWMRRPLPPRGADELSEIGLDIEALGAQAHDESAAGEPWRFQAAQRELDQTTPTSLYVFAVLNDDLVATQAVLWSFPGGPGTAFGDHIRVALDNVDGIAERISEELLGGEVAFEQHWVGASFIDSAGAPGPVVLSVNPNGPAAIAGLGPGDVIRTVDGNAVTTSEALQRALEGHDADATAELGMVSGAASVALGRSPRIADPDVQGAPFAGIWIAVRQLRSTGDDSVPDWVLGLNEAAVLLRAGEWEQVVRLLRPMQVPDRPGVGSSMASYWLGLALSELGPEYVGLAQQSFETAAADRDGRMFHDGGPLVWPLARARARRIQ